MAPIVDTLNLAVFVTPHGYGHAARATAVMAELTRLGPYRFEIFTRVPAAFFHDTLGRACACHPLLTDIGLVQRNAFAVDIDATVERLHRFYPPDTARLDRLAARIRDLGCRAVLCDIAPLGLAVARQAGLPSILLENFTWPWIYRRLPDAAALAPLLPVLEAVQHTPTLHLQTHPLCSPRVGGTPLPPISRPPRCAPADTRRALGIDPSRPIAFVTLGGMPETLHCQAALHRCRDIQFILAGCGTRLRRDGNILELPARSPFYHPDLVAAASVIVCKLGYSTVAEAFHNNQPLLYVPRAEFAESAVIARFVRQHMQGDSLTEPELRAGHWAARIPARLEAGTTPAPPRPNGADTAARRIHALCIQ